MQNLMNAMYAWHTQATFAALALCGLLTFHYATKLWSASLDAVLGAILGAAVGLAGALLFIYRHMWHIAVGTRASWFIALFVWCVLGMLFFTSRETRRAKLYLAIASQAGILYALFAWL